MIRNKQTPNPHRQDNRPVGSLEALYTELNGELFGGRLHPTEEVQLEWSDSEKMKGSLGLINILIMKSRDGGNPIPLRGSVKITIRPGLSPRQTRKTMAHEMAHLAAAMEDGTLKHNSTFWRVMESIGYGKHHRFEGETKGERDLHTVKSEERQAVWFWRKQPIGTPAIFRGWPGYTIVEVQKRGTRVRIKDASGFTWWVPATALKPLGK